MNESVRIAKLQHRTAQTDALRDVAVALIKNPVIEIVLGYTILEGLEREGVIPSVAATFAEGGVLTAVALQQASSLMPYVPALVNAIKPPAMPLPVPL